MHFGPSRLYPHPSSYMFGHLYQYYISNNSSNYGNFLNSHLALSYDISDSYILSEKNQKNDKDLGTMTEEYYNTFLSDPLDKFFKDKKTFLTKAVEDILGQINERMKIKYDNMYKIDYDSCQANTRLYNLNHWHDGANPSIDKIRSNIERELMTFEREKRIEEVASWRDITRLRSDLRDAIRELEQEKRRQELIGDGK